MLFFSKHPTRQPELPMSDVLSQARQFLRDEGHNGSSALLSPTSSPDSKSSNAPLFTDDDDEPVEFVLSIVDDKIHGPYEEEAIEVRLDGLSLDKTACCMRPLVAHTSV